MAQVFYFDDIERITDEYIYCFQKAKIDAMPPPEFGAAIHVLVITDRLPGCAKGLVEYLEKGRDITVDLVDNFAAAQQIINQNPVDFLVIVGYLRSKTNYKIVDFVAENSPHANVIMYANIDDLIIKECSKYKIQHMYNRFDPIDEFVAFMRSVCCCEVAK